MGGGGGRGLFFGGGKKALAVLCGGGGGGVLGGGGGGGGGGVGGCSKGAESKLQYLSTSLKLLIIVSVHGLECHQTDCCLMLMGCILGIRQEMIT